MINDTNDINDPVKPVSPKTLTNGNDTDSCAVVCSICLEDLKETVETTSCNHRFHKSCLEKWLEKSGKCPYCRYEIAPDPENDPNDLLNDVEIEYIDMTFFIPIVLDGLGSEYSLENLVYHTNRY